LRQNPLAPTLAPTINKSVQIWPNPDKAYTVKPLEKVSGGNAVTSSSDKAKGPLTSVVNGPSSIGVRGFEPPTSWSRTSPVRSPKCRFSLRNHDLRHSILRTNSTNYKVWCGFWCGVGADRFARHKDVVRIWRWDRLLACVGFSDYDCGQLNVVCLVSESMARWSRLPSPPTHTFLTTRKGGRAGWAGSSKSAFMMSK
jgi:hypothetical protein